MPGIRSLGNGGGRSDLLVAEFRMPVERPVEVFLPVFSACLGREYPLRHAAIIPRSRLSVSL